MSNNHDEEKRCKEAQFVDNKTAELIQRVTAVMPIADELHAMKLIHDEKYAEIRAEKTDQEKMRKLLESLKSGGDGVKETFYYLLEKHEPHLLDDLGGVNRKRKLDFDAEYPVPSKKLNTESNEQDNPNYMFARTSAPTYILNNIVTERKSPCNMERIAIIHPIVNTPAAPKTVKKNPAPKKEKPILPKEKKPPAPKKEKKPTEPKKKKTPAPKKEKKPTEPKKEKMIPEPKKEKKPPAPKKKTPAPKKEKKPTLPKKKKPTVPKKKKTPAPKKEKKPTLPKKKKPTVPKKKTTLAPKKVKKSAAPKTEKKPAGRK